MNLRSLLLMLLAGGCLSVRAANPFFAMDTGTRDATHQTPAQQVALVKELGFDGVGPIYRGPADLGQWLEAVDAAGTKLNALYVPLALDQAEKQIESLRTVTGLLKGRDTLVWLYVTDKAHPASSTNNDEAAVVALRAVADLAQAAGLRVALYPHTGFYVQRVEDAVRLAEKADRKNLGVTFNLCHWLKVDGRDLVATLRAAQPHLFCVTVNGADRDGKDWKSLIQPLDRGSYDLGDLLRILREMRYDGPIGLQHYGIGGDARENLARSIAGWRRLQTPADR